MSADIIASSVEYLTNGVEGSLHKGTNKLAMKIKDDKTLVLLTDAAVQTGTAEGSEFRLLQNDTETLDAAIGAGDESNTEEDCEETNSEIEGTKTAACDEENEH